MIWQGYDGRFSALGSAMGYHVSILRTRGRDLVPITEDDIGDAVRGRAGRRYERGTKTLLSSERQPDGMQRWLSDGELWTKNPDGPGIGRMVEIAQAMAAAGLLLRWWRHA